MALARVQCPGRVFSASAATLAITFASPPTVGNAVVVPVNIFSKLPTTCTDNRGNAYTLVATAQNGTNMAVGQFYCPAITGTGTPFTVTVTLAAASGVEATAIEVSGVSPGLAVDQFVSATGTSTTPATGATATLTGSEVFLAGHHAINGAHFGGMVVASVSPTWLEEFQNIFGGGVPGEVDSRVLPSASGTTTSISWADSDSQQWAALLVAYKVGAAAVVETAQAYVWGPL